jgi:citrate lyase subunit beta/citryl-CoA lyase
MRSLLFVPADNEKKLEKAYSCGADCILIDLEDSVAPAAKQAAREKARAFLAARPLQHARPARYVRVNGLESAEIDFDLAAVMPTAPEGILLPKCTHGADIQHLGAKLAVHEAENELAAGSIKILALVTETAGALFNMGTYAGSSPRLAGLAWGAEDLSVCLGAETNRDSDGAYTDPYVLARSLTLIAAAAANVPAIDGIYPNFRDLDGLRQECECARRDGFWGKLAIHPAQVEIINEAFTPSPEAVARAEAVVAAFAASPGAGVVSLEGAMLDRPHLLRAQRLLVRASKFSRPSGEGQ